MDFRSLEVFVWVATLGSFRGAAAKLNTTQPAVSQRIAQLEADLGVQLIDRSRRAVAPTARGRLLLTGAERLLRLSAELRAEVGSREAVKATLRLGVSETIVHTWLPRFIERVSGEYPKLAIEIEVDITPVLAERLAAHEIDLAFLLGPVVGPATRNMTLCRFPLAFLASPALGLSGRPVGLAEVVRVPLVTFSRRTEPYAALAERRAGFDPRPRVHASASLATVLRMALDGIGIALAPPAIAEREIAAGRLGIVEVEESLPDLAYTASWPAAPDGFLAEALAKLALEEAGR